MTNADAESNVEIVHKMISMLRDPAGMAKAAQTWMDPDVTISYPGAAPIPFARLWKGREEVLAFLDSFNEQVETISMEGEVVGGVADKVFIRGTTHGRVRRTGRTYKSDWMVVWTFNQGKVVRMVEYHDTQAIAEAFA